MRRPGGPLQPAAGALFGLACLPGPPPPPACETAAPFPPRAASRWGAGVLPPPAAPGGHTQAAGGCRPAARVPAAALHQRRTWSAAGCIALPRGRPPLAAAWRPGCPAAGAAGGRSASQCTPAAHPHACTWGSRTGDEQLAAACVVLAQRSQPCRRQRTRAARPAGRWAAAGPAPRCSQSCTSSRGGLPAAAALGLQLHRRRRPAPQTPRSASAAATQARRPSTPARPPCLLGWHLNRVVGGSRAWKVNSLVGARPGGGLRRGSGGAHARSLVSRHGRHLLALTAAVVARGGGWGES